MECEINEWINLIINYVVIFNENILCCLLRKNWHDLKEENLQAYHRMSEGAYSSLAVKSKGHKMLINTKGIPYALNMESQILNNWVITLLQFYNYSLYTLSWKTQIEWIMSKLSSDFYAMRSVKPLYH